MLEYLLTFATGDVQVWHLPFLVVAFLFSNGRGLAAFSAMYAERSQRKRTEHTLRLKAGCIHVILDSPFTDVGEPMWNVMDNNHVNEYAGHLYICLDCQRSVPKGSLDKLTQEYKTNPSVLIDKVKRYKKLLGTDTLD